MLIKLILRILPFYIREPLAMVICLVLCGACVRKLAESFEWQPAALAAVFLGIAVVRGFMFRNEWRSREKAEPAV
ncbi:hypothetical protein [Streptomyces sp. NBC_00102]|uniref:hypothetical protein n=1 Tax=Streptomyces sp. NBC_00102 TaxID=2975652 RepID=UPI002256BA48|nr:hypothetical protein [Streptomyces sp. NBC_00102]MCX5396705.1 hypothetical protein [Streptomyces sp. NBC_00102]